MHLINRNLILIFFIALSLRLVLFVLVTPWQENVEKGIILAFDDASGYHNIALLLAQDKPFNKVYDRALYQYFIVFLYSIFGSKPYTVIIFQIIMGALTCVFLYKITQRILPEKIALFAGLFLAFEYSSILYTNHLLTETMFTFLFIIHVYLLIKFLMEKDIKILIYSAIFLGLSTHIRSIGLYFLIFLIPPFFLYFKDNLRRGILSFLILSSVFFIIIAPWMVRNYIVADKFVFSPDQGRAKYWFFPNLMNIVEPPSKNRYYIDNRGEIHYLGHFNTEIQNKNIPKLKRYINAIGADMKSITKGMLRFLFATNSGGYPKILGYPAHTLSTETWEKGLLEMIKFSIREKTMLEIFFLFMGISILIYFYTTIPVGIYFALKKKEFEKIVLFVFIFLYFLMASSGPSATEVINPRHKIPIIPYLIILSCYGLTELMSRLCSRKTSENLVNIS